MNLYEVNRGYNISEVVYNRRKSFGPRVQRDLQLVYVFEGDIAVQVDGRRYALQKDEATLLFPGHREFFTFARTGATRHGWTVVMQPILPGDVVECLEGRPDVLPVTSDMQALIQLASSVAVNRDIEARHYRDALIQAIFSEFISRTGCSLSASRPLHPAVEKARRFMEYHFSEKLDVPTIADHAGVTPTHLIRLFRQHLGETPMQALWRIRCNHASRLLRDTALNAAEIAYQAGFANPQHFSRVFKKILNATPGAIRKQAWTARTGSDHA